MKTEGLRQRRRQKRTRTVEGAPLLTLAELRRYQEADAPAWEDMEAFAGRIVVVTAVKPALIHKRDPEAEHDKRVEKTARNIAGSLPRIRGFGLAVQTGAARLGDAGMFGMAQSGAALAGILKQSDRRTHVGLANDPRLYIAADPADPAQLVRAARDTEQFFDDVAPNDTAQITFMGHTGVERLGLDPARALGGHAYVFAGDGEWQEIRNAREQQL